MGRGKSYDRREQIVEATLELLADVPLGTLSTRQIAKRVGVSQPALFRHFRTRDAILEAVTDLMRERLSGAVSRLLEEVEPPLARARGLVALLFEHAERHPGLVRLVLAGAVTDQEGSYRASLDHLISLQRSLFTTFVRKAQQQGEVAAGVDPDVAARLMLALIHGTLVGWARDGRQEPLSPWAPRISSSWEAGLRSEGAPPDEHPVEPQAPRPRLASLDARPILASGADPLDAILATLAGLSPDGLFVVLTAFRPKPLLILLGEDGYRTEVEELGDRVFQVTILGPAAAALVDLSDLEAPLPLERVLLATAELEPGVAAHFRVPRVPRLLLPRLGERGIRHDVYEQADGRALLSIWRPR